MNGSAKPKSERPDGGLPEEPSKGEGNLRVQSDRPAAGPHAKPELTNTESTPGSGLLPDPDDPSDTADSASS